MQFGRYYEDIAVGDHYRHPLGRTISEADNTWFTLLTMNTNPVHFDANHAEGAEFGKLLVNSALTVAIVVGQRGRDPSHPSGVRRRHAVRRVAGAVQARVGVASSRRDRGDPQPGPEPGRRAGGVVAPHLLRVQARCRPVVVPRTRRSVVMVG